MSTTLRSDDKVSVIKTTGNNKPEYYPISELNELISSEEDGRITDLETAVGTYAGGDDISIDLTNQQGHIDALEEVSVQEGVPTVMVGETPGTIAKAGRMMIDSANNLIYVCVADTDGTEIVLDANWKTLTLTAISS